MEAVDAEWPKIGVEINQRKNVDGAEAEIQGAVIHSRHHWLGASVARRIGTAAATVHALLRPTIAKKTIERLVGLHGYAHTFRSELRSLFATVYYKDPFNTGGRPPPRHEPQPWHPDAVLEMQLSVIMLPMASHALDAPWTLRVGCYDANPGGHGLAWGSYSEALVSGIARRVDQRAPETNLESEFGISVDHQSRCPLHRIHLPSRRTWAVAARPGGYRHITLEEAEAGLWSLEGRLHRPAEIETRCLEGGDNAATVGAFMRGRSRSRPLNEKCRQRAAVALAGDLNPRPATYHDHGSS